MGIRLQMIRQEISIVKGDDIPDEGEECPTDQKDGHDQWQDRNPFGRDQIRVPIGTGSTPNDWPMSNEEIYSTWFTNESIGLPKTFGSKKRNHLFVTPRHKRQHMCMPSPSFFSSLSLAVAGVRISFWSKINHSCIEIWCALVLIHRVIYYQFSRGKSEEMSERMKRSMYWSIKVLEIPVHYTFEWSYNTDRNISYTNRHKRLPEKEKSHNDWHFSLSFHSLDRLTRMRKPVRIFVLNPVLARKKHREPKSISLFRSIRASLYLLVNTTSRDIHRFVRAVCTWNRDNTRTRSNLKCMIIELKIIFKVRGIVFVQVPRSPQQSQSPLFHSFSNVQTLPVGCVRTVLSRERKIDR